MSEIRQIVSFLAQDILFGVDVLQVQEIIRHVAITHVPLAPATVSGLVNMRGQIVTAIDLRSCLGFPERPSGRPPAGLILKAEQGLVGLIVDEIGTVFELPEDAFEPPPEILKGKLRALVSRVYILSSQLLLFMDTERLLTEAMDVGTPGRDAQALSVSATKANAMANGTLDISNESRGAH